MREAFDHAGGKESKIPKKEASYSQSKEKPKRKGNTYSTRMVLGVGVGRKKGPSPRRFKVGRKHEEESVKIIRKVMVSV